MPYVNEISFNNALNDLDLFDDIKGKYLKYYLSDDYDRDDMSLDVEMEQVEKEDSIRGWVLIIEFELKNPDWIKLNDNWKYREPEYIKFTKELDYDYNSHYSIMISETYYEESEEEEESDEEEAPS